MQEYISCDLTTDKYYHIEYSEGQFKRREITEEEYNRLAAKAREKKNRDQLA